MGVYVCTYMSGKTPISRRCNFQIKRLRAAGIIELQESSSIAIRLLCSSLMGDIVGLLYISKLLSMLLERGCY